MEKEEFSILSLANAGSIVIDYSDDDIIIIDNVKKLAEPSPTRVKMNLIVIAQRGKVQASMNGQATELHENQLLLCPPNVIFSDFMFSHDFEFKAVFLTNRILQSFLREKMGLWNEVMYIHRMHVVTMNENDIEFFAHFYDMLRLCIDASPEIPYRGEVIQSIIRGALIGLCGTLRQMLPDESTAAHQPAGNLFQRFLDLLNASPVKHQSVSHYARQLFVTPKYLSVVCKNSSGKTATEWIREQTMEDIRYYLRQTDLSIKQICDRTGFPNPSFFGKYVKTHFGTTPMQFRHNPTIT